MKTLFLVVLAIHYLMLLGIAWSIVFPRNRIWPPPKKESWQYLLVWGLFSVGVIGKVIIVVLDWNSWVIPNEIRFYVGIPVLFLGACFTGWGIKTLGVRNTAGEGIRFVLNGPYKYTRNPQYLGDIAIYIGILLISNSLLVAILQLLAIIVFVMAPFCEEDWLEEQYAEQFNAYKAKTTRFL